MNKKCFAIGIAICLLLVCGAFLIQEFKNTGAPADGTVSVRGAYAYATSPVQKNGAVFVNIVNDSPHDDKVMGASGELSERVELHTHTMDGDMMMMREVEHYALPAGAATILEPMGHHIMLMGLKAPLAAGNSFPITLTFEKHPPIIMDVQVMKVGTTP